MTTLSWCHAAPALQKTAWATEELACHKTHKITHMFVRVHQIHKRLIYSREFDNVIRGLQFCLGPMVLKIAWVGSVAGAGLYQGIIN